jgi:succinyl-CoA synthetase alpha subunit
MIWGLEKNARVMVQGITGHQGRFHAQQMLEFGTNVVAGVSPGKGGSEVSGVPVYDTMAEAVRSHQVSTSVLFVPAPHCLDAVVEAVDSGITNLVVITEHVPIRDASYMRRYAALRGARLLGPNCPGICIPGSIKLGIMPNPIFTVGEVAVVSRSGTLTYEVVQRLTEEGVGQSVCIGVGGDPVNGTSLKDVLLELKNDGITRSVVLIGEIGGTAEQEAALVLQDLAMPVVAYLAGRTAPIGKRMGHAGAIISKRSGTYDEKRQILNEKGAVVCDRLGDVAATVQKSLSI